MALTGIETIPAQADSAQPEQSGVRVQPASAQSSGALLANHPALLELQHKALAARRSAELVSHQKYANPELTLATTRDRGGYGERYNQTITVGVRIPFGMGSRHTEQLSSANAQALEAESALAAQRTRLLEIPSALPVIFGGLRVGVTLAVIGAVVAEWAGASTGLGILINIANQGLFDTPLMFVALATLAIIGLVFYGLVVLVERRLVTR